MWSLQWGDFFLTTFYGLFFNHHYTLTYYISEGPSVNSFPCTAFILMLCWAGCVNCNSNLDQKNPLPCQDLNPRPPWYQSNMLPTELSWVDTYKHIHYSLAIKNLKLLIQDYSQTWITIATFLLCIIACFSQSYKVYNQ